MFPQEIMVDIFSRLPEKSIGRFRCVSKPWRSLLSQPEFIKTHLNRRKQHLPTEQQSLIVVSDDSLSLSSIQLKDDHHLFDEMTAFATPLKFDGHQCSSTMLNVDATASCDGLILVKDEGKNLVLLNPSTREIQVLPKSPYALNPQVSHTLYGLGYDCVSDDYKAVTLSYYDAYYYEDYDDDDPNCTAIFVNIYSVRHGTWKEAGSSPYDHAVGYPASGVFVDGCIHWLASKGVHQSVIAAFNLEEEKFQEVPPPSLVDRGKFVFDHLVAFGGCLCLFSLPGKDGTDVWMLKEYGVESSWIKFTVFDTELEYRPLCLLGKDQVVLLKDVDPDLFAEKLVIYNFKEGNFKNILVHGISNRFCVGAAFIESLVSPLVAADL